MAVTRKVLKLTKNDRERYLIQDISKVFWGVMKEYYIPTAASITTNVNVSVKRDNEEIKGGTKYNSEKPVGKFTGEPNYIQVKVEILEIKTEIFETKTEIINREKIERLKKWYS